MNTLLANTLIATAGIIRGTLASAFNYLNTLIKSGTQGAMQFHQEGIAFAREMGMNAKEAQAYTEVLTDRTEKLAMKYGVAAEQVRELQRNISVATSRQLMLNESQAEGFLQLNKLVGSSTVTKFTEEMMNGMGGQLNTVQGAVSKAYASAAKSGLNAQKVSEKIANNLSMANKLSFRTGIDGLTRMAMQAEKVGMSLNSVEQAANAFMEIDSAIEASARLNMLGGQFAMFGGNPLDMAYEANADPEALMNRLVKMAQGSAKFDAQKGIATVDPVMMDMLRNAAKAMGMSPDELVGSAKKQASNAYKESHISSSVMAGLTQEQKDFLINKSDVANGKVMFATTGGKKVDLSSGGTIDKSVIEEMMKYQGMSDRDIMEENARSLSSINEILTGIKESIKAMFAKFVEGLFPKMQGDLKQFGAWAKNKLEPLAKNVGESVRGAYDWLKEHKEPIKSFISHVIGFLKFATEHWKILLGVLAAKKLFGMANSLGMSKGLGGKAARGAANAIGRGGKWLGRSIWDASKGRFLNNRAAYSMNRGSSGRVMSAIKAPFQSFGALSRGAKALTLGGAGLGVGIGTYNAITADNNADRGAGIGTAVGTALGAVVGGPIGAAIGGFLGDFAGRFVGEHWGEITDTISKGWDVVVDGATSAWKWLSDGAKSVWEIGKSAFGTIFKFGKWLFDNNPIAWVAEGIGKLFGKDWSPTKIIGDLFGGGEKHAKGGVIGGNSYSGDKVPILANSGEAVITPQQFNAVFGDTLVKPKPLGENPEYIYKPNRSETSNVNGNTITVKDFNINISGTLRLDAGNYSKSIDGRELLNDYAFMTQIKNMIKESINRDINGGKYLSDLATMANFPAQTGVYGKG